MQKQKVSLVTTAVWTAAVSFVLGVAWVGLDGPICWECMSWDKVVVVPVNSVRENHYWYCKRCRRHWSDRDRSSWAVVLPSE
jgi:transposase-like protein